MGFWVYVFEWFFFFLPSAKNKRKAHFAGRSKRRWESHRIWVEVGGMWLIHSYRYICIYVCIYVWGQPVTTLGSCLFFLMAGELVSKLLSYAFFIISLRGLLFFFLFYFIVVPPLFIYFLTAFVFGSNYICMLEVENLSLSKAACEIFVVCLLRQTETTNTI